MTKRMKKVVRQTALLAVVAVLAGCVAEEAPLQTNEPFAQAASAIPCEEQYAFQRELNGVPDDIHEETSDANGIVVTTEKYWYADAGMIVFFAYSPGESWCNVWNENGVGWRH